MFLLYENGRHGQGPRHAASDAHSEGDSVDAAVKLYEQAGVHPNADGAPVDAAAVPKPQKSSANSEVKEGKQRRVAFGVFLTGMDNARWAHARSFNLLG